MSVLKLNQLSTGYQGKVVGQQISLDFNPNEVVCLLGANGCGKTTLLKTLLGTLPPLAGEVLINGKPQSQWNRAEIARFIGYVPQAHNGVFPFSVEEVVLMGRTAHLHWCATPGRHDKEITSACLEMLGIIHLKYRNYMYLSGGERQLIMIARALAQEPAFLIMDEPTASLDFGNQVRVLDHIDRLRGQGMSILMTTHQPEHALRIADRIVLLYEGRILAAGSAKATMNVKNLALLYGLEEEIVSKNLSFVI